MPRRARIDVPGYPLHIVQRGHNRAACFLEPSGFELYLGLLNELHAKFGCSIHAFVLMTNHVHLLLTPETSGAASELLRRVNLRFVQSMNRTYGRTGPGWEGRFWSSVVESGRYLMTCQRYIELNPLRAGLVKSAETYPWSSFACNAFGSPCPFLTPHAEYMALGGNADRRRAAYRSLFLEPIGDDDLAAIRKSLRSSLPLGCEAFLRELEARTGRPMRIQPLGRKRKARADAAHSP
jgi:putative transposase